MPIELIILGKISKYIWNYDYKYQVNLLINLKLIINMDDQNSNENALKILYLLGLEYCLNSVNTQNIRL